MELDRFNYRYIEFSTPSGKGYATFAIAWKKVQEEKTGDSLLAYKTGFSFCSPKDRFTKRFGRKVAYTRLTNDKGNKTFAAITKCSTNKFITNEDFKTILKDLIEFGPGWAQRCMKRNNFKLGLRTKSKIYKNKQVNNILPASTF